MVCVFQKVFFAPHFGLKISISGRICYYLKSKIRAFFSYFKIKMHLFFEFLLQLQK